MARTFGEWLKERRRAVGLRRQEDLAAIVGVTQPTVSSWETGDNFPDRDKIPALAAALQCTPEEVLERAYDASYGTVGELSRNLRQILEWARRQELRLESLDHKQEQRFDSVATVLEAMTHHIDSLQRQITALSEESSDPPGRPGGNPRRSVPVPPPSEAELRLRR